MTYYELPSVFAVNHKYPKTEYPTKTYPPKRNADIYRRLRNTLRYLLGNLTGFDESERVGMNEMPELERWVLHRLWQLDRHLRQACDDFQFHPVFAELHNFCAVDLSALYFDVRKDSLYCDPAVDPKRRAAQTVLDEAFNCLTAWLAPFLCFTAEEAWQARYQEGGEEETEESVHLRTFPDIPEAWRDDDLAAKWAKIRELRRAVTGALEVERAEKRIGSSLEAHPIVYAETGNRDLFEGLDAAELFITSGATFSVEAAPEDAFRAEDTGGVAVQPNRAEGEKCRRCWKILPEVGQDLDYPDTCGRCADVVRQSDKGG